MSTPPILPPVGPSTPPIPSGPTTFTTTATTSVDNQSTYSSDIAAGNDLTIIGFSSIILSNTNQAAQTAWQTQQYNATSRKDFYNASIEQALDLVALYSKFLEIASKYTNAARGNKNAIDSLNAQINTYNSSVPSDQAQVNTLNLAIANYNAGLITQTDLQIAIDNFNAYATSRNIQINNLNNGINSFNGSVVTTNIIVGEVNAELEAAGAPPLEPQDGYNNNATLLPIVPNAAAPPVSTVSYSSVTFSQVTNTMRPVSSTGNGEDLASALFQPYFSLMGGQFAITAEMLQQQSSFQGFVQFILQGKLPFFPDTFYVQSNPVTTGGNSTSGSVSSTALTASLSNTTLEAVLSQNKFLASVASEDFAKNFNVVTRQLQYLQSTLLSQLGLQTGSAALRFIEGRLPFIDLRSSPVAAALGLTLASEIGLAVANGDINSPVKSILARAFPSLDAANLNSLAKQLSTTMELSLLLTGLFQLGQALGNPQLAGQVTATLTNADLTPPSVASLLNDKKIADLVRETVSRELAKNNDIALRDAKDAVNQALKATNISGQSIGDDYSNSLIQQGIDAKRANDSANLLRDIIHSEVIGRNVLNNLVKDSDLSNSVLSNQFVSQAVDKNPDITFRELRDQLTNQFTANGATPQEAINAATLLVTGNPLTGTPSTNAASLSASLQATGTNIGVNLGLNPAQSQALGADLQNTVTNLRTLIDERLGALNKDNNFQLSNELKENLNKLLAPTLDLYVFADKLRDPANTFLLCAQTGIMYAHPQPTNYLKDVDFKI